MSFGICPSARQILGRSRAALSAADTGKIPPSVVRSPSLSGRANKPSWATAGSHRRRAQQSCWPCAAERRRQAPRACPAARGGCDARHEGTLGGARPLRTRRAARRRPVTAPDAAGAEGAARGGARLDREPAPPREPRQSALRGSRRLPPALPLRLRHGHELARGRSRLDLDLPGIDTARRRERRRCGEPERHRPAAIGRELASRASRARSRAQAAARRDDERARFDRRRARPGPDAALGLPRRASSSHAPTTPARSSG